MNLKLDQHVEKQKKLGETIAARFDQIEKKYAVSKNRLSREINDRLREVFYSPSSHRFAFVLVDIQNDFVLKDFALYASGGENTVISNMALLDAIIKFVTENPELASKIDIITSQDAHVLGRTDADKDSQIMAKSSIGNLTQKAIEKEQTELKDINPALEQYDLHCMRGTIGAAISQPIEKRLKQLAELYVIIKRYGKINFGPQAAMLLKNIDLSNPELLNPESNIYDEKAEPYMEHFANAGYECVYVTGICGDVCVQQAAESLSSLGPNKVAVLDPFVHYLTYPPARTYELSRKQATDSYEKHHVHYPTFLTLRSNPDSIIGYEEACTFVETSPIVKAIEQTAVVTNNGLPAFHNSLIQLLTIKDKPFSQRKQEFLNAQLAMHMQLSANIETFINPPVENIEKATVDKIKVDEIVSLLQKELNPQATESNTALTLAGPGVEATRITDAEIYLDKNYKLVAEKYLKPKYFKYFKDKFLTMHDEDIFAINMFDIRTQSLIEGAPEYCPGAEHMVMSHMAMLDALNEYLELFPSKSAHLRIFNSMQYDNNVLLTPHAIFSRLEKLSNKNVTVLQIGYDNAKKGQEVLDKIHKDHKVNSGIITGLVTKDFHQIVENLTLTVPMNLVDMAMHYDVQDRQQYFESHRRTNVLCYLRDNRILPLFSDPMYKSNQNLNPGYTETIKFCLDSKLNEVMDSTFDILQNEHDDNIKNPDEASILEALRNGLMTAYHGVLLSSMKPATIEQRKQAFLVSCRDALSTAQKALPENSAWKDFCYALLSVLVSVCTLFIANIVTHTYPHALFTPAPPNKVVVDTIGKFNALCDALEKPAAPVLA